MPYARRSGKAPLRETLRGHREYVQYATFNPDGQLVLTASDDVLGLWSASTGKLLDLMDGHTDDVTSAAFSPDGRLIVSTSFDGNGAVIGADQKQLAVLEADSDDVTSAAFSPDGKFVLTANDRTARLWSRSGEPGAVLRGHTAPVNSGAFSSSGALIVTASTDQTARIWPCLPEGPAPSCVDYGGGQAPPSAQMVRWS